MDEQFNHDMSCVPYKRTWLYLMLTVPLLAMMGFAGYILWTYNFIFTIIYISIFAFTNLFQSYCCHYQECPYVGGFCPAVAGIVPASLIAKIWQKLKVKKNKLAFEILATLGALMLLGLILFPLYWLFIYHIVAFVGYLLIIIIYAFAFLLLICPACAIRDTCPGGKVSGKLIEIRLKENETKEE